MADHPIKASSHNKAHRQENQMDTSFKARKPSDKKLGSFGTIFGKDKLENARPTT